MASKPNVIFVSGPRHSGKTTLVHLMAACATNGESPHYIRLVPVEDQTGPRLTLLGDLKTSNLSSWKRVNYDATRIFELLPECLRQIAELRGSRTILIEADADPALRYAYPYDQRIFVMRCPETVKEVFRSPNEAAVALREVMDDTAAFASEMFGLFDATGLEEDEPLTTHRLSDRGTVREERMEITAVQMRRFMNSPLGAEVASRIQLQPPYHSLMESDLIVVNMGVGAMTDVVDRVIRQVQTMINRLGGGRLNRPQLVACDPLSTADPTRKQLILRFKDFLAG